MAMGPCDAAHGPLFLIDRDGIVQWIDIEGAGKGMEGIGTLATDDELFAAVGAL